MEENVIDTIDSDITEDADMIKDGVTLESSDEIEEECDVSATDEILEGDIEFLREEFPALSGISYITELPNPTRYAALRDLGLTPREAYLATAPEKKPDNRSHLVGGVPHAAKAPVSSMTRREWNIARALFEDMSDYEIEKLYKKVTR